MAEETKFWLYKYKVEEYVEHQADSEHAEAALIASGDTKIFAQLFDFTHEDFQKFVFVIERTNKQTSSTGGFSVISNYLPIGITAEQRRHNQIVRVLKEKYIAAAEKYAAQNKIDKLEQQLHDITI